MGLSVLPQRSALVNPVAAPTSAIALSPSGATAIGPDGDVLRVLGGPGLLPTSVVAAAAVREGSIWLVDRRGRLHRFDDHGAPSAPPIDLGALGDDVRIEVTDAGVPMALIEGERAVLVREAGDGLAIEHLGPRGADRRVLIDGRGVLEHQGGVLVFRNRCTPAQLALPPDLARGRVAFGAAFVGNAALVTEHVARDQHHLAIHELRGGTMRTRVRLGSATVLAIARRAGILVLGGDTHLALFDLREGRVVCERTFAAPIRHVAVDGSATRFLAVDETNAMFDLVSGLRDPQTSAIPELADPVACEVEAAPVPEPAPEPAQPADVAVEEPDDVEEAAEGLVAHPLLALRPCSPRSPLPRAVLAAYLDDTFVLVDAWCKTALAHGSTDAAIAEAEREAHERYARWNGAGAPLFDLADEFGLSPLSRDILLLAAAPLVFGELRAAYASLAADHARPLVDELLIGRLLDADRVGQLEIAAELDEAAPLRRHGLIDVVGSRPIASLEVPHAVVRRIAGDPSLDDGLGKIRRRVADRTLHEIWCSRPALQRLIAELERPEMDAPVRVVLRGPLGSGRSTLAATLAEAAGRNLGIVEIGPASADDPADLQLRRALQDVHVRGWIPCVSSTDGAVDHELRDRIRAVLDAHPGPLFVRAPAAVPPPLSAGYLAIELRGLDIAAREACWSETLARHDLPTTGARTLAQRYGVGPGLVERAAARAARGGGTKDDAAALVEMALRQERAERIAAIASRADQLASWDDLVLPEDMSASLRELVARVQLRTRVLDEWGMARIASTARGVTALFQGAPGTGKTLAAGVIASELGYELYRVDLSRVLSKWIGETEKHLGEVFDAAEGGECVLLFDEADSLFGKRTEVKSSHDRYANVEINYLLQRLDSFEGVAILTTNFGTAIDPAFKRRLSLHLQFPFPDEEMRERLWRAHLPATLPMRGDLELRELARRYQLSGGYIRNAALRAAFLAAADETPIDAERLRWAVQAEFRDRGKVSSSGVLE